MCERCIEIDRRIARLKTIAQGLFDPQTVDAANGLIKEMEVRKAQFHPDEGK